MIAKKAEDRKQFMAMLLKDDVFDKFLVRSVSLRTNVTYEIDCAVDENWYDSEDRTALEKYAFWSEIRPVVFNLIKGSRGPGYMKIILSAAPSAAEKIHRNAAALFINITFEKTNLLLLPKFLLKDFVLHKIRH